MQPRPPWSLEDPRDLHSSHTIGRNATSSLLAQGAPLAVGVLTLPIIVRGLGPDGYGAFSLAWALLGYFSVMDLGLGRATTKFVAEYVARRELPELRNVVASAVAVQLGLGLVGAALWTLLVPLLVHRVFHVPPGLVRPAMVAYYLLAPALPVILVSASYAGVLEALQRFDLSNRVRLTAGIATYALPLPALWLGTGLVGVVVVVIAIRVASLAAFIALCQQMLPGLVGPGLVNRRALRRLVRFGGWVTVTNVVSPVMVYFDRMVIGASLSLAAVTYYTAPYDVVTRLSVIPASLMATLFPAFSMVAAGGNLDRLRHLLRGSVKYLLVGMGPLIVALAALTPALLRLWLGPEFAVRSSLAARLLLVGVLINGVAQVPFAALQGTGRPDVVAKFHLLELPTYLVALYLGVHHLGIAGAAGAWLFRVAMDGALLSWAAARTCALEISVVFTKVVFPVGAALAGLALVAGGIGAVDHRFGVQLLVTAVGLAGFSLLAWHRLLDPAERAPLLALLKSAPVLKRLVPWPRD